ncbi:MAG: hypothetical protein Q9207_002757 [Kuettlingeria erythrocarpa]
MSSRSRHRKARSTGELQHSPTKACEKNINAPFDEFAGMVFTKTNAPKDESPNSTMTRVKDAVRREIMDMQWGSYGNLPLIANPAGQSWVDHDTQREERHQSTQLTLRSLQNQIFGINKELLELRMDSNGYKNIRRRFFAVYYRDVLGLPEYRGDPHIQEGDQKAHAGDVLADALLFRKDSRHDHSVFQDIYGMHFTAVLQWRESTSVTTIFDILNAHGSLVANQYEISPAFRNAFRDLLRRIEPNFGHDPYEAAHGTSVHFALDVFVRAYTVELTRHNPPSWLRVNLTRPSGASQ